MIWLAAGDHGDGHFVDPALHVVDALVGDDGQVGQFAVELEQGLGAVFDGDFDLAAHFGNGLGEGDEFVIVGRDDVVFADIGHDTGSCP